jgi:hypothetical protein
MKKVWVHLGNARVLAEASNQSDFLPAGIYRLGADDRGNPILLDVQEKFEFPYKIYRTERDFIDRVQRTWEHTSGNLGILLNGLKGTGKTITAEIIANEMKKPIILVNEAFPFLNSFLNDLNQDVVVLIDEYEKIFDEYDNSILPVMDGAMKSRHRILFLLTTNELRIDRNMLQRPGRIRYIKTFGDLSLEVIMEVVDDFLKHKQYKDSVIKFISELPIITMDLVKSIIQEVNIHDEEPAAFEDFFNIHSSQDQRYDIFEIDEKGDKKLVATKATLNLSFINEYSTGQELYLNARRYFGVITKVFSENHLVVERYGNEKPTEHVVFLEKVSTVHKTFQSLVV